MCLSKNRGITKNKTIYIGLLLQKEKLMRDFYLRAAFNGLKIQKEIKKFDLVSKILGEDTKHAIHMTGLGLQNHRTKAMEAKMNRKMDLVACGFGRKLYQYFKKWKDETLNHKLEMRSKFQLRIIEIWRNKQMHAFFRWKELGRKQMRKKRKMIVEDIQH